MKSPYPPTERACRQCGQNFLATSPRYRYCSKACVDQYNIDNKKNISAINMYPYEKKGRRASRDGAALEIYHTAQSAGR